MIHTPQQSEAFLQCINALITNPKYKLVDCSWRKDECDKAGNEKYNFKVIFPNMTDVLTDPVSADENFPYFCVAFHDEEYIDTGFTLHEVISLINSFDKVLRIDDSEVSMLEYIKANYDSWDRLLKPVLELGVDNCFIADMGAGGRTHIDRIS